MRNEADVLHGSFRVTDVSRGAFRSPRIVAPDLKRKTVFDREPTLVGPDFTEHFTSPSAPTFLSSTMTPRVAALIALRSLRRTSITVVYSAVHDTCDVSAPVDRTSMRRRIRHRRNWNFPSTRIFIVGNTGPPRTRSLSCRATTTQQYCARIIYFFCQFIFPPERGRGDHRARRGEGGLRNERHRRSQARRKWIIIARQLELMVESRAFPRFRANRLPQLKGQTRRFREAAR